MKLLHILANPKPAEEAASKQVTEAFLASLREGAPEIDITTVDLYQDPPPYYDYAMYRHFWYPLFVPGYQPSDDEQAAAAYALRHGALLNAADVLAITSPMWNFTVPAILKAWIDQVIAPGLTFTMGAAGPQPLHHVSKIVVLAASGGAYGPEDSRDNFSHQLQAAFGFAGMKTVEFAWADGQNTMFYTDSSERKAKAIDAAKALAAALTAVTA